MAGQGGLKIELKELLYKVAVEKQYEYIDEIMQLPQIWSLIWSRIKNYPHRKEEIKNIAIYKIKEAILAEYMYEKSGTEGKFINFLKRRPLARIHEAISWEIFNVRVPKKRNGKKKRKLNQENPEVVIDNYDAWELNMKRDEFYVSEEKMELLSAIKQLNEIEQKVIYMKFYEDKTDAEIGIDIKKDRTVVTKIKNKAIKKLHEYLS